MRKRANVRDWLKEHPDRPAEQTTDKSWKYLLGAMRSQAPGQWSQDLLELTRHFTSAAFLAINTQATQASSAELRAFERNDDQEVGDWELHHNEPLLKFLHNPNDEDSFGDILYQMAQQLGMTGISLVWTPPSALDAPNEMYVISSASALPWPPSPIYPHGSYLIQPYYPYGPFSTVPAYQSAAGARIPAEQIIRVKNHHPYLRYDGYAVLTALSRQIDTIDAIDMARWQTQQKGTDPTVSLEYDPAIIDPSQTDMVRLREQLEALYAGPLGKKIWMNPIGTKMTKINQTPAEMAWTEGWSQLTDFTLACYGTPKSVAGLMDDVSYATLYASLKQYYLLSLNPLLKKISDKWNKRLVPYFGDDLYITLTGQKITDDELKEKQLDQDAKHGVITENEYRKERDRKPWPDGDVPIGKKKQDEANQQQWEHVGDPDQREMDNKRPEPEQEGQPQQDRYRKSANPDVLATLFERAKTQNLALPAPSMNGKHHDN